MIDLNVRQRMLDAGYESEVIEFLEKERVEQLRFEFLKKNVILNKYYRHTSYYDFMEDVFFGLDEFMVITGDEGYRLMDVDQLMDYQVDRDNVYVAPASFINGCYSGATCRDLYAVVIDIDKVSPETLDIIIENGNLGSNIPMPTYITNSGSGVHFYYVFEERIPYYFRNRGTLNEVYRKLCGITKQRIAAKTDWHGIIQPFRMPGSLTKLGQETTAWKCGEKWPVKALAARLHIESDMMDLTHRPLQSQEEYREAKRKRLQNGQREFKQSTWVSSAEGNIGFYEYCLNRCYQKTQEGNRYMSMVGLSVVAFKVGLNLDRLECDLRKLLRHYNDIGKVITLQEMKKAMRAYNPKAVRCRSVTLEEWFGWEFQRVKKEPKGMTREEALEIARFTRDLKMKKLGRKWTDGNGRPSSEKIVRNWRQQHPDGRPKDCMVATGLSKNTVYKWWKESQKGWNYHEK